MILSPGTRDTSGARPSAHGAPPPVDQALLGTPVLIIEDEAMIAWMLEALLDDMGFTRIVLASHAEAAIAAAHAMPPGLIVSDINLGAGLDGVDAVAAIAQGSPVRAIFVTGYAGDDTRTRIAATVPNAAVLRKPVQLRELQRAVIEALEHSTAH